jgi:hypothetical protein
MSNILVSVPPSLKESLDKQAESHAVTRQIIYRAALTIGLARLQSGDPIIL